MNEEDYVTYKQAVKLDKLGFDWDCFLYYVSVPFKIGCEPPFHVEEIVNYSIVSIYKNNTIPCPTLSQATKWLREVKGLFINVWLCAAGYSWEIDKSNNGTFVTKHDEESGDDENSGLFTTYEKALSAGINKALELLTNE